MNLTIQQIIMELKKRESIETNIPIRFARTIRQIRMIDNETQIEDPGVLYILCTRGPAADAANQSLHAEIRLTEQFRILVPDRRAPSALMNLMQEIIFQLWQIQNELQEIALEQQDYAALITTAEEKLGLCMLLVDRNLHYLAETESFRKINYQWMEDAQDITLEWVNVFNQDEAFMGAIQKKGAFLFTANYLGDPKMTYTYCYNVRVNGGYEARLLMQRSALDEFHGGLEWVDFIGSLIEKILVRNYDRMLQTSDTFRFYEKIQMLAEGQNINPDEVRSDLFQAGWTDNCHFQVYLFRHQTAENETINHRYFQSVLHQIMGECVDFRENEDICIVRNITRTNPVYRDVHQELTEFLRDNLFYVGISNEFTDIFQLKYYFREASDALQTGLNLGETSWSFRYENYILKNMLRLAALELPENELEHPALKILREYDRKEGTELVKTVFAYMENRYNVSHTAKALYIHRTTMLFRLERIEKLTGIDWTSMEDRVLLGISTFFRF